MYISTFNQSGLPIQDIYFCKSWMMSLSSLMLNSIKVANIYFTPYRLLFLITYLHSSLTKTHFTFSESPFYTVMLFLLSLLFFTSLNYSLYNHFKFCSTLQFENLTLWHRTVKFTGSTVM